MRSAIVILEITTLFYSQLKRTLIFKFNIIIKELQHSQKLDNVAYALFKSKYGLRKTTGLVTNYYHNSILIIVGGGRNNPPFGKYVR